MVDVAHDGDDRRTGFQLVLGILSARRLNHLVFRRLVQLDDQLAVELRAHKSGSVIVKLAVDGGHIAQQEELFEDLPGRFSDAFRQVLDRDGLRGHVGCFDLDGGHHLLRGGLPALKPPSSYDLIVRLHEARLGFPDALLALLADVLRIGLTDVILLVRVVIAGPLLLNGDEKIVRRRFDGRRAAAKAGPRRHAGARRETGAACHRRAGRGTAILRRSGRRAAVLRSTGRRAAVLRSAGCRAAVLRRSGRRTAVLRRAGDRPADSGASLLRLGESALDRGGGHGRRPWLRLLRLCGGCLNGRLFRFRRQNGLYGRSSGWALLLFHLRREGFLRRRGLHRDGVGRRFGRGFRLGFRSNFRRSRRGRLFSLRHLLRRGLIQDGLFLLIRHRPGLGVRLEQLLLLLLAEAQSVFFFLTQEHVLLLPEHLQHDVRVALDPLGL